jgi:hypothetical protein
MAANPNCQTLLVERLQPLPIAHRALAWSMAVTGMEPKEYWGRWELRPDRIHIERAISRRAAISDIGT